VNFKCAFKQPELAECNDALDAAAEVVASAAGQKTARHQQVTRSVWPNPFE
jgi:hypothetical protein